MLKDEQLEDRLLQGEATRLEMDPPYAVGATFEPARKAPVAEKPAVRQEPIQFVPVAERAPQEAPGETEKPASKSLLRRRPFASALGALLLAAAVGGGYVWWESAGHFESTDDAFIAARQIAIAPKISGYVNAVPVTDNQHVAAGDVIASLDDRDYRVALDQANAQVASAWASIENIDAQTTVQRAQIESAQAQADQARAALVFAQQQQERYQHLARTGYGSEQNAQQYNSQLDQQQAALKSAQAAVVVAQRQIESLKAQRDSAQASLAQASAQRDQAQLNLSYAKVVAVEPGRVVNLTAEPGEFAQAGTNLTMFVPDETWVTANFKENQLDAMRPGEPVTLSIDAYPERDIHGRVASVQPGSGTAFSLLPAQNATGNYVKVVQRVPVKIVIDNLPKDVALGPGMSVVPSVRVNAAPTLYEKLTASIDRLWSKP
jgi:membrane fusion protein (multidrug efflux system)